MLGWVEQHDDVLGNTASPRETREKNIGLAKKGLAMDISMATGHSLPGMIYQEPVWIGESC